MLHSSISMVRIILLALFFVLAMTHVSEGLKENSIHLTHFRRKQDQKHHKPEKHHDDHGKNHNHGGKKGKDHHKHKPRPAQHKADHHKNDQHKDDHHKDNHHKDDHHKNNKDGKKNLVKDVTGLHLGKGGDDGVPGLLKDVFHGSKCPHPRATVNNPNGNIHFLNCGINGAGWNPPPIQLHQVHLLSGKEAIKKPIFKACAKFYRHFKAVGDKYGIPSIMLMSFAMQESSCQPQMHGANGEIGMMQVTPANCQSFGVQPQNAWDPRTNIDLGAQVFMRNLKQSDGNVPLALGSYNGWQKGMTKKQAMNTQFGCLSQRNLDYVNALMNGFYQGRDGHSKEFLIYNNLARCHGHQ